MKKKIIIAVIFIIVVIILIICSVSTEVENNVENITEIEPEEEITDDVLRQTDVTLYFADSTSGILVKEIRKVDSKELIDSPYRYVLDLLIKGPDTKELSNPIPEGTKVNSLLFEKGIITVDFSEEFTNSSGTNSIYSIVNTLTEFNEVNGVKITVNGEVKDGLKDVFVKKE